MTTAGNLVVAFNTSAGSAVLAVPTHAVGEVLAINFASEIVPAKRWDGPSILPALTEPDLDLDEAVAIDKEKER